MCHFLIHIYFSIKINKVNFRIYMLFLVNAISHHTFSPILTKNSNLLYALLIFFKNDIFKKLSLQSKIFSGTSIVPEINI